MHRFGLAKIALIASMTLLSCLAAKSESRFDQPYLGAWTDSYARFSPQEIERQADLGPAGMVRRSAVICLGSAHNLKEIKPDDGERVEFYEADVKVVRLLKGTLTEQRLHLKFRPSATSIEEGAEHVFLLQKEHEQLSVVSVWYVYGKAVNQMRVVGAYNCSTEVGFAWLQHMIDGQPNEALSKKLLDEYRGTAWGAMYSAVVMAAAAPNAGADVLVEMISVKDRTRFDLDLYCQAAVALAKHQGDQGLRTLLKNIPKFNGYDRIAESVVFDLVASYGSTKLVPELQAFAVKQPEYAVSVGFAMSGIGGAECRDALESLSNDKRFLNRSETISDGHSSTRASIPSLLKQALSRCPRKSTR